jgi:hypothetical protein
MESIDDNFRGADLKLTGASIEHLRMASRWAQFMGIIGFIGLGLMLLGSLAVMAMSGSYSRFPGGGDVSPMALGLIYLVMVVLYFFPIFYLFQFAVKTKQAIEQKDSVTLEEATSFLRRHYQFVGIFTIVILSLYILMILIGLFAVAMR